MTQRDPVESELASRYRQEVTRREFLRRGGLGLGSIALSQLLGDQALASIPLGPRPRARNVIYLFMAGAPSQFELFDPKETLQKLDGKPAPASFTEGKRFAFIDGGTAKLMGTRRAFAKHGECGAPVSELLPYTAKIVDKLCFLRGVHTNEINHGPAKLFMNTGFGQFGRPSLGSWVLYGLGSDADELPGFVVLQSGSRGPRGGAPLWGNGFLPTRFAGTPFRSGAEAVLNLKNPTGVSSQEQGEFIDVLDRLNRVALERSGDPEILSRIAAYELGYKMQSSAPELNDVNSEPESVKRLYGVEDNKPSFARNCLLARRMIERGVRFVQLYHADWDHHGDPNNNLGRPLEARCREVDQGSAALVSDLERRGLLDDTLVIWGGEFGRTPMSEVRQAIGRDHHIDAFTLWMAGGGVKRGFSWGETDEIGYSVTDGAVHVHDLHATILHILGVDHKRLTYRFQGRDYRLTDVHGRVVHEILA